MFQQKITTRFSDTDALGHINNTKVPVWFESGRDEVFKWFTPDLDPKKWQLIIAKIDVSFHSQMYYGTDIEMHTYISRIGGSSFDVYQELWQNNQKCASGTAVMVHYCFSQDKAITIPTEIRTQMTNHLYLSSKNVDSATE